MKAVLKNIITAAALSSVSVQAFAPTKHNARASLTNVLPTYSTSRIASRPLFMDAAVTDVLVDAWSSYNVALEEQPLLTK